MTSGIGANTLVNALWLSPIVIGYAAVFAGFILFVLRLRDRMNDLDAAELDGVTPEADSPGAFWADVTTWQMRRRQEARR